MTRKKQSKPKACRRQPKPMEKKKENVKPSAMETEESPPAAQSDATPTEKPSGPATPPETVNATRPVRGPQCFKCQRWGHLSYGCSDDTHCVKCSLGHRASECPKKPDEPCRCFNCGGEHPSSYRGCPAAPKSRRRRRPRKNKPRSSVEEKDTVIRAAKVLCRLLTTKNFFTELQLQYIRQQLKDLPAPQDASTQSSAEIDPVLLEPTTPAPAPQSKTAETQTDPPPPVPETAAEIPQFAAEQKPVKPPIWGKDCFVQAINQDERYFFKKVQMAPHSYASSLTWREFMSLPFEERKTQEFSFLRRKPYSDVESYYLGTHNMKHHR